MIDWIYRDKLPRRLTEYKKISYSWALVDTAYKVAHQLMMDDLQNELMNNLLTMFGNDELHWNLRKINRLWDADNSCAVLSARSQKYGEESDEEYS